MASGNESPTPSISEDLHLPLQTEFGSLGEEFEVDDETVCLAVRETVSCIILSVVKLNMYK